MRQLARLREQGANSVSSFTTSASALVGVAVSAIAFNTLEIRGQGTDSQKQTFLIRQVIDTRPWPHRYSVGDTDYVVYAPQPDTWIGNTVQGRAVMSVTTPEAAGNNGASALRQDLGVIWFTARTETDKQAREVTLTDLTIDRVNFPTAKEKEPEYAALVRKNVLAKGYAVSLDQFESELALDGKGQNVRAVRVNDDPPEIVFSRSPAVLVRIDGRPQWRATGVAGIERLVNSPAILLHHQNRYWLKFGRDWISAVSLDGPWSASPAIPAPLTVALRQGESGASAPPHDTKPEDLPAIPDTGMPAIYVRTHPTEVIVLDGDPEFAAIPRTRLRYVTNTPADVFVTPGEESWFVLVSGRWFTAPSSSGPWKYVSPKELPSDFTKIPADSPKSAVLASIAGTPEAREALVAASIPQTATIDRTKLSFQARYDGAARFKPIAPTSLSYAWNSPEPIIRFGADTFYALDKGVWFTARSENGPWSVATSVPQEIYAIPPFSPLHYVTYVRVYGAKDNDVYVGYTPGYYGAVVSDDDVVVYGTGYDCQAWVGRSWYGCPSAYGYGAVLGYGPTSGWTLALGWASDERSPEPVWGPWAADESGYTPYAVAGIFNENVYGTLSDDAVADTVAAWAHPFTGNYARYGLGGYYNIPVRIRTRSGESEPSGDLYAGSDGNVYLHRQRSGWQKKTDAGEAEAARVLRPDPILDKEKLARDRAFQREQLAGFGFEPVGARRSPFDRSAFGAAFRGPMGGLRAGL